MTMNTTTYQIPPDARPAASLLLLRDGDAGLEVLMLRRAESGDGDSRSGAAVFPGGRVDAADRDGHRLCHGLDDATLSRRMGLAEGGLDYVVAALRECFEEVGLLAALDAEAAAGTDAAALHGWREMVHAGEVSWAEFCDTQGLRFDLRDLAYYSHWLTPPSLPKRFDTRFFAVRAPAGQQAVVDATEAVELMWLTPAQALASERGLKLLPVTRRTLQELARFDGADAALADALARTEVPLILPRVALSRRGREVLLPGDAAWAEVGRLDPDGCGDRSCELVAGVAVRLSPRIVRVTAPNPGLMTGPGTNSYLVGAGEGGGWTVIDPGPDDPAHLHALLAAVDAVGGTVERILVTHTHADHSPGAAALARATGAPVLGRIAAHAAGQDASFAPTALLHGGETLALGAGCTLQVLHTPGHASNHLCYRLVEERLLFTGDHVMQGSTVVINPPDGDMGAYLRALQALLAEDLDWLAPGHGFLVAEPQRLLRGLIAHRLAREARVLGAVQAAGAATLDALLPVVYADVPERLHPVARRSLLAHLLKLRDDARVELAGDDTDAAWRAVVPVRPAGPATGRR